jgi:hypothetical protein
MSAVTFEQVVRLAEQLSVSERAALVQRLQATLPSPRSSHVTRDMLLAELAQLRAEGAFEGAESLYGKYANPNAPDMSEDAFHAHLHAIATEWEQELDDFDPKTD